MNYFDQFENLVSDDEDEKLMAKAGGMKSDDDLMKEIYPM